MPKFYVESGPVRLIFDAVNAKEAAVKAFEWSCRKQVDIEALSPLEFVLKAEEQECQLDDTIAVNERGFQRFDSDTFDTLEIVAAWQSNSFPGV